MKSGNRGLPVGFLIRAKTVSSYGKFMGKPPNDKKSPWKGLGADKTAAQMSEFRGGVDTFKC